MIETIQTRTIHRTWLPARTPSAGVAAPLSQALRPFAPISLASMDAVALLNRIDRFAGNVEVFEAELAAEKTVRGGKAGYRWPIGLVHHDRVVVKLGQNMPTMGWPALNLIEVGFDHKRHHVPPQHCAAAWVSLRRYAYSSAYSGNNIRNRHSSAMIVSVLQI